MVVSDKKKPRKLEKSVIEFANLMLEKLQKKSKEGVIGWDDPKWFKKHWFDHVHRHFTKSAMNNFSKTMDMVDVANYLMFRVTYIESL